MSWFDDIGDVFDGILGGVNDATSGLQDAVSSLNSPLLEQVAGMGAGYLTGQGMGGLGSLFSDAGGPGTSSWGMDLGTDAVSNDVLGTSPMSRSMGPLASPTGTGFNAPAQQGFNSPLTGTTMLGGVGGGSSSVIEGLPGTGTGNFNLTNTASLGSGSPLSALFSKMPGGLSGMQLAGSLYDMYAKNQMANKQQDYINGVRNQINSSYAPGSPEYEMMKKEIAARDAMAGRNSQWGARATELAGKVNATRANTLAQTLGPLGNLQAQQSQNQFGGLNSLFGFASQNARMKQLQDMVGKSSGNTFNIGGL